MPYLILKDQIIHHNKSRFTSILDS